MSQAVATLHALGLLGQPQQTCIERICVDYGTFVYCYDLPVPCDQPPPPPGLGSSAASGVIEQRFSIPDRSNIDNRWRHMVNHIEDHFGKNTFDLFEEIETIGIAGWHAMHESYRGFGYSIPFDWRDQIPTWAVSQETMTSEQIWNTRNLDTNLNMLHFDAPGTYGYGGTPAYGTLQTWGVSAADAARVVDQIYDVQAEPRWSPNYRVLSIEAGGGTSAEKIAKLDEWLTAHGIQPINPPSGEFITSPAVMREILRGRGIFADLVDLFSDQIIGDLLFLHDQTGVQRQFLMAVDRPTLESLLSLHQQYAQAVANLTARVAIPDPVNDPGFLRNIVKAIWKTNALPLTSIPFKPIDDLSQFLMERGIWGPLFPLSTGPDWEEPIESPVVISAMLTARGFSITSQQVAELLKLHARPSVPASFVTTVSSAQLQTLLNLHAQYVQLRDAILQEGILIEPDASALVGEFYQSEGHLNRTQGLTNETLIAHLVTALTAVTVTVQDVDAFEIYFGLEDQITFDGILAIPASRVDEYINIVLKNLTAFQHLTQLGYSEGSAITIIRELKARGILPSVVESYHNRFDLDDYLTSLGIILA